LAKAKRREEFVLTLTRDEALYLYEALEQMSPSEKHFLKLGGDPVYTALKTTLISAGVFTDFDQGTYAVRRDWC
jgi:hypothetical protein